MGCQRTLQEHSLTHRKLLFSLLYQTCVRILLQWLLGEILTEIFLKILRPCHSSFLTLKCSLLSHLRECITLTEGQEQDLAQLKHKLQEVGKVSVLLKQHFQDVLSRDDPDNYQGQAL